MKKKRVWIIFAVSLAVLLPASVYVMENFLDTKTGFYSDGGVKAGILSACTAAAAIIMAVLAYADSAESRYQPSSSTAAAAFCAFTGVFIVVQSVSAFAGQSGFTAGTASYYILSVLGLPTGAVFLVTAYDLASGTQKLAKHPIFALLPSVWGCMYLIMLFILYAAVVNSFSSAYNTCTAALVLLFMFSQAKFFTGVESEGSRKRIYTFGMPAAFLALINGISACILYFSGKGTPDTLPIGFQMLNILAGAYIISFLASQKPSGESLAAADVQSTGGANPGGEVSEAAVLSSPASEADCAESAPLPAQGTGDLTESCVKFLSAAYPSSEKFAPVQKSPF